MLGSHGSDDGWGAWKIVFRKISGRPWFCRDKEKNRTNNIKIIAVTRVTVLVVISSLDPGADGSVLRHHELGWQPAERYGNH